MLLAGMWMKIKLSSKLLEREFKEEADLELEEIIYARIEETFDTIKLVIACRASLQKEK